MDKGAYCWSISHISLVSINMPVNLNRISGYLYCFKCQNYPIHFQPTTVYKQNVSILPFVAKIQQAILGKNTTLWHFSQHIPPKHFEGRDRHTVMSLEITSFNISIVKPTTCTNFSNFFIFGIKLYVSERLSGHHQDFKTVHTATGVCQTGTATCLTYTCCCMYSLELLMMDRKDHPKHVECYSKNK